MDIPEELLRGIYSYGFEKPSAIQQRAIKPTMMGRDLIAQAQSGTVRKTQTPSQSRVLFVIFICADASNKRDDDSSLNTSFESEQSYPLNVSEKSIRFENRPILLSECTLADISFWKKNLYMHLILLSRILTVYLFLLILSINTG